MYAGDEARRGRVPGQLNRHEKRAEVEEPLTRLERLAESFPEDHTARLLIESAVGSVRARGARKVGTDVSRSRSTIEGEISTLRGVLSRESSKQKRDG